MNRKLYLNDNTRPNDSINFNHSRIDSKVIFKTVTNTGEKIWEPLHNKTVIAGSAITAMKLFGLSKGVLSATPSYDVSLELENGNTTNASPTKIITDANNNVIASVDNEFDRKIIGFCVGRGGAGLDISDVFDVKYCGRIEPDMLIPFQYPILSNDGDDGVDEDIYKGKKTIGNRVAYYFKTFSNSPTLRQCYVNTFGNVEDNVSSETVYNYSSDLAQSFVEIHLNITKDDCREFFSATDTDGLQNAKINQLSLVTAWTKKVHVIGKTSRINGNDEFDYFQDIRPFSVINIPNEIISDNTKSISCIYTLYF